MGLICWIRYYRHEKVYRESSKSDKITVVAQCTPPKVNPSTPWPQGQGLPGLTPSTSLRASSERHFFTPPLKTGLGAVERVKNFTEM